MITTEVIALLGLALIGVGAICLLAYGIYSALTDDEMDICVAVMNVTFLCLSVMSGVMFNESYKEYKNAILQNQIKILRQKISDAEKEYQKYLIDHPELKELAELEQELR